MSKTVDIPGGQAVIRDADEMTERQRRIIRRVMIDALGDAIGDIDANAISDATDLKLRITPQLGDAMFDLRDAAIVAGLASWSLPEPLPTVDTVQDLPTSLYDALEAATGHLTSVMSVDTSPSPEPDSPTQPSSASGGLLRGEAEPTITWSTSGASTSTANSSI